MNKKTEVYSCSDCGGTGIFPMLENCDRCGGTGLLIVEVPDDNQEKSS